MKNANQLDRLREIDLLIRKRITGSPNELAKYLGVGRSHLYRCINMLKDLDAPIRFSRKQRSFIYTKHYDIDKRLSTRIKKLL